MARYVDKKGGLLVEKTEPTKVSDKAAVVTKTKSNIQSTVSAEDVFSAIGSYLSSPFTVTDSSSKGECVICGKQTAYANRMICVDCFKEHKDSIMDGLKSAVKDVDFKIE